MAPAPKARFHRRSSQSGRPDLELTDGKSSEDTKVGDEESHENDDGAKKHLAVNESGQPRDRAGSPLSTLLMRRSSAGIDGRMENVPVRASFDDIKQHLKHLGPSNPASNPKTTRSTTVKIKPGIVVHEQPPSHIPIEQAIAEAPHDEDDDERTSLLRGKITPKDGAHALASSYGATGAGILSRSVETSQPKLPQIQTTDTAPKEDQATQTSAHPSTTNLPAVVTTETSDRELRSKKSSSGKSTSGSEHDYLDSPGPYGSKKGLFARSGSITEQVVETRGIKKTVLGTTSSNEDEDEQQRASYKVASRSNVSLTSSGAVLSPVEGEPSTPLLGSEHSGARDEVEEEGGPSAGAGSGNQNGSGNGSGGGKKKNRRKKRKGKS